MITTDMLRKKVYVILDPIDQRLNGKKSRVIGPFRVVQFSSEGIYASARFTHPERIAVINEAGRYVTDDGREWDSARTISTPRHGDLEQAEGDMR